MTNPGLYGELAPWFHLLTPPSEYAEEAAAILALLRSTADGPVETLLELGSGGGNTASHLRRDLRLTLTDLSPEMLALSRTINPDIEHVVGDMRTLRLDRTFDGVLIHDAICYMVSEADLRAAFDTAFVHLRPGGAALFAPDHVRDAFKPETDHGGEDGPAEAGGRPGKALRYLEWVTDPDPTDDTYQVDYAVLVRDAHGTVSVHHDRQTEGLFAVAKWLRLLADAGFLAVAHPDVDGRTVFAARRPKSLNGAPSGAPAK